jgi:hypothetical protein
VVFIKHNRNQRAVAVGGGVALLKNVLIYCFLSV